MSYQYVIANAFYLQLFRGSLHYKNKWKFNYFPRQSLKRFTFRVKSNDSIFFLLGLSPIAN